MKRRPSSVSLPGQLALHWCRVVAAVDRAPESFPAAARRLGSNFWKAMPALKLPISTVESGGM